MTGHEPAFYLIALIAGLYVATSFVVDFAQALLPRPSPAKLTSDNIVEIVTTAFRTYGLEQSTLSDMREDLEGHLGAQMTIASSVEQLQKQMSTCITNIKDIAAALNEIAPVVAAAKQGVAGGVAPVRDVSAMSDVQRRTFFRQKSNDINGNKTSAPTENDGSFSRPSAAEKAAELVAAMQAEVRNATDVQLPGPDGRFAPLPPASADRHNRDMIG